MGKPKAMVGHQRVREKDGYSGCQSLINNNIKKKVHNMHLVYSI